LAIKKVIYISCCTPSYKAWQDELLKSMLTNGIPKDRIDFAMMGDTGTWDSNVKRKVLFCIQKHKQYRGQDILLCWVDSDAIVTDLEFKRCGIALPFLENFEGDFGIRHGFDEAGNLKSVLSGTFIWRVDSHKNLELLETWYAFCAQVIPTATGSGRTPTQKAFRMMWNSWGKNQGIDLRNIPLGYIWIKLKSHKEPFCSVQPIIIHDLASRKFPH